MGRKIEGSIEVEEKKDAATHNNSVKWIRSDRKVCFSQVSMNIGFYGTPSLSPKASTIISICTVDPQVNLSIPDFFSDS